MISQEQVARGRETLAQRAEKHEQELARQAESYLKGVVDFVKWTSAIASAAMLWIGNNVVLVPIGPLQKLTIASLVCLAAALTTAIITVRQVLTAWGHYWTHTEARVLFNALQELKEIPHPSLSHPAVRARLEAMGLEAGERVWKAGRAAMPLRRPKRFNTLLTVHMSLLLAGLILYILAQVIPLWSSQR